MTRALFPLIRAWKLLILRWALREINPTHPDVPRIVRAIHWWEQARG